MALKKNDWSKTKLDIFQFILWYFGDKILQRTKYRRVSAYWRLLVNSFNNKLLIIEGNISDLTPGEAYFGSHPAR